MGFNLPLPARGERVGVRGSSMRGPNTPGINRARVLRHNTTEAEARLWRHLRNRQLDGFKFVRQQPIGRYYADFVCREPRLVVEVDGGQHVESETDKIRDRELTRLGYRTIRIWNIDVFKNIEGVLLAIRQELDAAPHPNPLPADGERESEGAAGDG